MFLHELINFLNYIKNYETGFMTSKFQFPLKRSTIDWPAEIHGSQYDRLRPLDELQISEGGQLECAALKGVRSLVDDQHVQNNVVLLMNKKVYY